MDYLEEAEKIKNIYFYINLYKSCKKNIVSYDTIINSMIEQIKDETIKNNILKEYEEIKKEGKN